jgi:hypothetical protein
MEQRRNRLKIQLERLAFDVLKINNKIGGNNKNACDSGAFLNVEKFTTSNSFYGGGLGYYQP